MVLFAHFRNNQGQDLDAIIRGFNGFTQIRRFSVGDSEGLNAKRYLFENEAVNIEVCQRKNKPDLVTVVMDQDSSSSQDTLTRFKLQVEALGSQSLTPVTDYELFSDPDDYEFSRYWRGIHTFIDSCRPRPILHGDSFTSLVDSRTGEWTPLDQPPNKDLVLRDDLVGIEYRAVGELLSLDDLNKLQGQHFKLLRSLGKFIQYVEVSKRARDKPDLKAVVYVDEIMRLSYDLLARPQDHRAFTEFIDNVMKVDEKDRATLYHSLDFIHGSVTLVRSELKRSDPNIEGVLNDLQRYGRTTAIVGVIKRFGERYPELERIDVSGILDSKYSEYGLLRALKDIEDALLVESKGSKGSDLDCVLQRMLRYGGFASYVRSTDGASTKAIIDVMRKIGFNTNLFTSDEQSNDVLVREETSIEDWQKNFHGLIDDFRRGHYNVFFMKYKQESDHGEGNQEEMDHRLRDKVLSLSPRDIRRSRGIEYEDVAYILNKVKGMLHHCRVRQDEKKQRGKKVDAPLLELEERLENLEIQLEFGARPTGGMVYSRAWHRVVEDFSREDRMLCCAALGGDKQDLTFRALYNPTYVYLTHFIQGVESQLGFSILKAGRSEGKRALLSISPYEANPAIRTALGQAGTYRYVLDAMVKAAYDAHAEYLLIDDIDLKIRDDDSHVMRMKDGKITRIDEEGYNEGEDLIVKYRNGEACAPRSFRKHLETVVKKYNAVTHEDIAFEQIEGDNELVEEQFGLGKCHYSIQSARARFNPTLDHTNLSSLQTKQIFDDGYHQQNGIRTVFKIDVARYIEERKQESIALTDQLRSIHGVQRN